MVFKRVIISLLACLLFISGCAKESDNREEKPEGSNVVQTYLASEEDFRLESYYELTDGTWKTDEYSYQFKIVLTGRLNNAAMDTTFICLSNSEDISFSKVAKSFLSSNTADFLNREDVVVVEILY